MISNQTIIDEWSVFSNDDLAKFGDDGDSARKLLLDPTTLELLGNIKDKEILDAGCGNGYFSRKLAGKGALVTGIEPAENLFKYCTQREKESTLGINYQQKDLSDINISEQYDIVVAINVFMDIPDYKLAIKNCITSLKSGGTLIFSILHPCFPGSEAEWSELGYVKIDNYFNVSSVPQRYGHLFHRTLQDYLNAVIENDCQIDKVIEPQLSPVTKERNSHVPQFLFIKARKS